MKVAAAQIDITPQPGLDLAGFAARVQPSVGTLDSLFARCIYIEDGDERLLWIGADVIAFEQQFVQDFRDWAGRALGLMSHQVVLCATHTHSAPATIDLTGCGRKNDAYLRSLAALLRETSRSAAMRAEDAQLLTIQAPVNVAVDRRRKPSAHVDPLVTLLGWRRDDGSLIAAALNYAMHPVALGSVNRLISADWCGYAAARLSADLPGHPPVLVSNGAAGNLNPPGEGVSPDLVKEYGERVVEGLGAKLLRAQAQPGRLRIGHDNVTMPLETLSAADIDRYADRWLATIERGSSWEKPFSCAIEIWRNTRKLEISQDNGSAFEIELCSVDFAPIRMLAVNGEMFSRFTQIVRERAAAPVFVVAYANTAFGYIPTKEACAEGGYEVETAHFFYNSFRPKLGSLEMLAKRAVSLINAHG